MPRQETQPTKHARGNAQLRSTSDMRYKNRGAIRRNSRSMCRPGAGTTRKPSRRRRRKYTQALDQELFFGLKYYDEIVPRLNSRFWFPYFYEKFLLPLFINPFRFPCPPKLTLVSVDGSRFFAVAWQKLGAHF